LELVSETQLQRCSWSWAAAASIERTAYPRFGRAKPTATLELRSAINCNVAVGLGKPTPTLELEFEIVVLAIWERWFWLVVPIGMRVTDARST
jgi:hypothetical protein